MTLSSPMFIFVSLPTTLPSAVGDDTEPIGNVDPATVTAGWWGGPGVGPGWTGVAVAAAVMVPLTTAPTLSIGAIFAHLVIFENCKHLTKIQIVSYWTPLVTVSTCEWIFTNSGVKSIIFNHKYIVFFSVYFVRLKCFHKGMKDSLLKVHPVYFA